MHRRTVRMGFTLVELLVVMAIVALLTGILVPAVLKGRKQASVNKAKAEMAGLSSTGSMIFLDTGRYVRLGDYEYADSTPSSDGVYEYETSTQPDGITGYNSSYNSYWDGPYTTYQSGSTSTGTNNKTTENAPLDPWGLPYWLVWNNTRQIMVIYSAGPDKKFDTSILTIDDVGSTQPYNYDSTAYPNDEGSSTDDIDYCFK